MTYFSGSHVLGSGKDEAVESVNFTTACTVEWEGREGTFGAWIVGFQPHEGKRSLGLENVGRLKTPIVGFEYLAEDRPCSHLLFCFESREKVFAPFNSDVLNDEVGPLEEVVWIPSLASVTLHRLVDGAHKRV